MAVNMKNLIRVLLFIALIGAIIMIQSLDINEAYNFDNDQISVVMFLAVSIIATILFIPGSIIGIIGGIVFGPVLGTLLVVVSATIGSIFSFMLSRYFSQFKLIKKIHQSKKFKKMDEFIRKNSTDVLVVTRLLPLFPFSIQNYYYGLTNISIVKFSIITFITIIPGTFLYCYFAARVYYDNENILIYLIVFSLILIVLYFVSKKVVKTLYNSLSIK